MTYVVWCCMHIDLSITMLLLQQPPVWIMWNHSVKLQSAILHTMFLSTKWIPYECLSENLQKSRKKRRVRFKFYTIILSQGKWEPMGTGKSGVYNSKTRSDFLFFHITCRQIFPTIIPPSLVTMKHPSAPIPCEKVFRHPKPTPKPLANGIGAEGTSRFLK